MMAMTHIRNMLSACPARAAARLAGARVGGWGRGLAHAGRATLIVAIAGGAEAGPAVTSFFPAPQASGTQAMTVYCAQSGPATVSFGMPFPGGFVTDSAQIR